ncbi:hypothetical protein OEA41_007624 [Lepraria neglecta]|uniref:Phosphatidylinositol-specific phospholipase C X domain-containing protein n=1 Tax=Lepraria neglecta TaxID=209136 RepID=A0AAD9ZDE4_9LECA|nr:hypothetical protein OEA41_007624 [Lepraria neglecta]
MATPALTIRNLTSHTINIKHYEINDLHHTLNGGGRFSNITSLWSTQANSKPPQSSLEDVSLLVEPFKSCKANVKPARVAPVREQLQQGVRFLDIRVQPEIPLDPSKDGLILVHGVFPISLTGARYFRTVVNEVFEFLDQHPSETIIMSLKREGPGNATDAQLSRILRDHYAGDVNLWFTAPRIPTLAEARGKIVLIRRFTLEERLKNEWGGAGWCINGDTWADNSPHSLCPSGDICFQDFYEVLETESIEKKVQYSIDHLKRAAQCVCPAGSEHKQPFYVNFLTASNFWKQSCWPDRIAAKLNPAIVDYLCTKHNTPETINSSEEGEQSMIGDGSTGIVVCDWVGHEGNWDIVRCIIGMNAAFEAKEALH